MTETLTRIIQKIELAPEYIPKENKEKAIRAAFGDWRKKNRIVDAVMNDITTFSQEYQNAFGEYSGKIFRPYSLPPNFKEDVADLEKCIGDSYLKDSNFDLYVPRNPVAGLSYASAGLLNPAISLLEKKKMSKRDVLKASGIIAAGFAGLGAILGAQSSMAARSGLNIIKENAAYLDTVYNQLYKTPNKVASMDRLTFFKFFMPRT